MNQKKFLDTSAKKLKISSSDDWYKVKAKDLIELGGRGLLQRYGDSLIQLVKTLYPDKKWEEWRFIHASKGFWDDVNNQKKFLDTVSKKLNIFSSEDWYQIKAKDLIELGGKGLLDDDGGSNIKLITTLYPDKKWEEWRFTRTSKGFWDCLSNQQIFLETAATEWSCYSRGMYNVKTRDLLQLGASTFIQKFGGSFVNALKSVYPKYKWKDWNFLHPSKNLWKDATTCQGFLQYLEQSKNIVNSTDWARITNVEIHRAGGSQFLKYFGCLNDALQIFYNLQISPRMSEHEAKIWKILETYSLGATDWHLKYKHPKLSHRKSHRKMELDIFSPSLRLAIEFHGDQHFFQTHRGNLQDQQRRDEEKRVACKTNGITLIILSRFNWVSNTEARAISKLELIFTRMEKCSLF